MFNSLICHKLFILPEPSGSMEIHIQRAGMGGAGLLLIQSHLLQAYTCVHLLIFPPSFHGKKGFKQVHVGVVGDSLCWRFSAWRCSNAFPSTLSTRDEGWRHHRLLPAPPAAASHPARLLRAAQRRPWFCSAGSVCRQGRALSPGSDPIAHINYKKPGRTSDSNRVELLPDE